ncbi:MAG TPA: alpha-amylase family glycosyl hydrolase [Candidatus Binatia bacterium]|nr:alpha-amylase family glycosyl hydrolase [Candidatus Binatia bacterium]
MQYAWFDMERASFEFHIAREARDRYRFADRLFSLTGNVVIADLAAGRDLAHRMNTVRDAAHHPDRTVNPGALNAMGLLDEVTHVILAQYRARRDPRALLDALGWFEARLTRPALDTTLLAFADRFPTVAVYRGVEPVKDWLAGHTAGLPHRAVALEELITVWLANLNPAFRPFGELFDDAALAAGSAYREVSGALHAYFESRPRFGPANQNLIDMLRAPALAAPESLEGQLEYVRHHWSDLLGDLLDRLLLAMDVLKEEQVALWLRFHPPGTGLGQAGGALEPAAYVPSYAGQDPEHERFSQDAEWMARTVLIAKNTYVWLDQLSRAHGRPITRLDHIPDEALATLARRGFSALWLIGLWERSRASQRIKQLCGNPEAVASAYSLYDYRIASDLGGGAAYDALRERARAHGIRLASDMVPNHMGIDSRWVMEYPERFLSLPSSPFPVYRFDGPNLSDDGRVEIKIEDHYYDRSDAGVVFRRVDRWTGDTRFIYHGNDGTSFPWNDTAQLDFTRADVREAVIQTILWVARQCSIIRFDAAMTLAKRHFHRLWFPEPGSGGAIPSRAERGMSRAAFDAAMPIEFWREVVDRVAAEAPGTLLLAEAFWLMEGYFVRTLGMHRVYNSAFMVMLRDEDNAKYRLVVKNTLEFDPDILKRYVNFMNNPDERTAIDQFGNGDKYFGVCTLMATMPGLPMFGHGQVEGFTERYGMEYRRAYYDEHADPGLIARHERQIAPLLHRRELFAEAHAFRLYDFFTDEGWVSEDVFAYSNRRGEARALVVYHNRYARTQGWVRTSCAWADKGAGEGRLVQATLGEALGASRDPAAFVVCRDAVSGLEHLHRSRALADEGLRFELEAYTCHVFLDWREVMDDGVRPWGTLADRLGGRGVPSVDEAMRLLLLEPVHAAFRAVLDPALVASLAPGADAERGAAATAEAAARLRALVVETEALGQSNADVTGGAARGDVDAAVQAFERRLDGARTLSALEARFESPWPGGARRLLSADGGALGGILAWAALEALGRLWAPSTPPEAAARLFDALRLRAVVAEAVRHLGVEGEDSWRAAARARVALAHARSAPAAGPPRLDWLADADAGWLTGVHEYEGKRYFVQEPFETLVWWMALPALLALAGDASSSPGAVRALERDIAARLRAAAAAGYCLG